jgi:inhibitor of cysteine peptidase
MKKLMGILMCMVLTAAALSACNPGAQTLTESDDGKTVTLNKGETLVVKLDGNPTTGYGWQLADFDQSVLKSAGDPDYKSDSLMTGSGGRYTYKFTAQDSGEVVLKFSYLRPWETDTPPYKTFTVTVDVK